MVVTISAKKGFSLGEYGEEKARSRVAVVSEGSAEYQRLFEQYREMRFGALKEWEISDTGEKIGGIKEVLDSNQIREFVIYALAAERETTLGLGKFVSKLVKNSYEVGNRKFKFDLRIYPLTHLLTNLGLLSLEIEFVGETGAYFAHGIKRSTLIGEVFGDIIGFHSQDSTFRGGSFGKDCGEVARRSTFVGKSFGDNCGRKSVESTFTGELFGPLCGNRAYNSIFTGGIFGEDCGFESKLSVYRTWDEDTLDQLFREVPRNNGNHIALVTPNGEEIRRYSHYW
jgi:hypothetical protein